LKKLTKPQKQKATITENKDGSLPAEKSAILEELYNYQLQLDTSVPDKSHPRPTDNDADSHILPHEIEDAIRTLKEGKSPKNDSIPTEFMKHIGPTVVKVLTVICQTI